MRATVSILVLSLTLVACARADRAMDAASATTGKMDDTIKEMKKTNEVVRKQAVQVSLDEMLKPENGKDLDPVPFHIMPFAESFGEYATPDETVKLAYLWIKLINEMPYTGDAADTNAVMAYNLHKLQIFSALESVCGLLPQAKVDQIIANEIDTNGRFAGTAKQVLFLRAYFLNHVMLDASLLSEPLDNVGKLEKAIEYADSIDRIARLPFAKEIGIKITGFKNDMLTIDESITPHYALDIWSNIQGKSSGVVVAPQDLKGDEKANQKLYVDRQLRVQKSLIYIGDMINGWKSKP